MVHRRLHRQAGAIVATLSLTVLPALGQATAPAGADARAATPATPSTALQGKYRTPRAIMDRLPLATDTDVAWDKIAHWSDMRWDCRAIPSGRFVMNSLCADKPKVDTQWPGTAAPPGWDGMVHLD